MTIDVLESSDGSQIQADTSTLILEVNETVEQLVVIEGANDLLEVPSVDVLVTTEASTDVLEVVEPIEIVEIGIQGPPGPPGPMASAYLTLAADGSISGHKAVRTTTAGKVGYASSAVAGDANTVLGISRNAAADGDPVYVQMMGEMVEPTWTWNAGEPVFCGIDGALTQSPPTEGFQLIVGIATAPTKISIGVKLPIITL